jgi:hypothetical protein
MPRGTRRPRLPRSRGTNITARKQREIESDEYKLFTYQKTCFKCVALVQLSDLSIGCDAGRLIDDQQNVVRLKRTLRSQGCYRLSNAFHVPVVIDVADWDAGRVWLQQSTLGPAQSLRLRQLRKSPDYTLLALDQESLITAARARFRELGEENPWWIVDVYVTASGPLTAKRKPNWTWLLTQLKATLNLSTRSSFAPSEKISTRNGFPPMGAFTKVFVPIKA